MALPNSFDGIWWQHVCCDVPQAIQCRPPDPCTTAWPCVLLLSVQVADAALLDGAAPPALWAHYTGPASVWTGSTA
jgi:hypothetical protein